MDQLRLDIKEAVDFGRTTYKDLAEAIGKNHAYIQQYVARGVPKELREGDAFIIRAMVERKPGAGLFPAPSSGIRQGQPDSVRAPSFQPNVIPGDQLVGDRDFPVYAAARGGEGHLIVTFDPVEYVKRPAVLDGVKKAYGIYITGDSMSPAFEPGDMALVHPNLPPVRDKDVVLYHVPPGGESEAIIKRLVSFNDREWTLKQYNPALEFTESRVEWPHCHRVVGKYSAR